MNIKTIGVDIKEFFNDMVAVMKAINKVGIDYSSNKYPTLRILGHKGYVYLAEYDAKKWLKYMIE